MLLQATAQEDFLRAAVPYLRDGMVTLKNVADILLSFNRAKTQILKQTIQKGVRDFQQSCKYADEHLQKVDKYSENLTLEKGQLESNKTHLKTELANIQTQPQATEESLQDWTTAEQKAKADLDNAQRYLDIMRAKAAENQTIRDAGIGLMFIPFVGLIAGSVMVGVGQTELENAQREADNAVRELNNARHQVSGAADKLTQIRNPKASQRQMIRQCACDIERCKSELVRAKQKQEYVSLMQTKLRHAVHFLGVLTGKVKVAEDTTLYGVFLEPLLNVMKDVMGYLFKAVNEQKQAFLQNPAIREALESLHYVEEKVSSIDRLIDHADDFADFYGQVGVC